jgi:hypothetical protein
MKNEQDLISNVLPNLKHISYMFYKESFGFNSKEYYKHYNFEINKNNKLQTIINNYSIFGLYDKLNDYYCFNNVQEININNKWDDQAELKIEENESISSITKLKIVGKTEDILYIPIKSYKSLNVLSISSIYINLGNTFPLLSETSSVQFPNLEYLYYPQ